MSPQIQRSGTQRSDRSTHSASSRSTYSEGSYYSRSTAPTEYDVRFVPKHHENAAPAPKICGTEDEGYFESPRQSVETYASTVPSLDDLPEEPRYQVPAPTNRIFASEAISTTPPEFAELFPSTRTLLIRHDDATPDGNMNLRVDTEVPSEDGGIDTMILFHLKMQDLKDRKFSLRRYCRESGREVCHSGRKYIQPDATKRPGIQRSLSNALSTLNSLTHMRAKPSHTTSTTSSLKRQDSGYDSEDEADDLSSRKPHLPTNTIQLEFSNYAHVDVKRRGVKSSKQYEFEFWGQDYQWKREIRRDGNHTETFFHLVKAATSTPVAHIAPQRLSQAAIREEEAMGGWIPPCLMWISDSSVLGGLTDVADVIVATGLIALVDDCIKRRWHSKRNVQLALPSFADQPSKTSDAETSTAHRMIDETFGRRGPSAAQRPTPLRQNTTGK